MPLALLEPQLKQKMEDAAIAVNEEQEKVTRKVLDDRYLLLKTIGHGRYAK